MKSRVERSFLEAIAILVVLLMCSWLACRASAQVEQPAAAPKLPNAGETFKNVTTTALKIHGALVCFRQREVRGSLLRARYELATEATVTRTLKTIQNRSTELAAVLPASTPSI